MSKLGMSFTKLTEEHITLPFYSIMHPIDAFEMMKYRKNGSYRVSFSVLLLWMFSEVFVRKNKGFIFSNTNPDLVNIFDVFSGTLAIFIILAVSNFLLCIFMEGEGTFKEIFCCLAYGTLILSFFNIGTILLTKMLSIEMASFLVLYTAVLYVWGAVYIVCGIMAVHQFTFGKSVLNIVLSVVGLALIAGLLFLLYSLFQQVASFFYTIYNEILFRL